MSERIPCTVEILTHNSGKTLRRALESVESFAEIIVIDGNSSDDTLAIAREYGARVVPQDAQFLEAGGRIKDFAAVRNQGFEAATQPWFLFLDSDEYLSDELASAIRTTTQGEPAAYWVYRKYELDGVRIECASTYPNRNMRLFHTEVVTQFIKPVHERIEVRPGVVVRELPSSAPLVVPVTDTPQQWREKNRRYLAIGFAAEGPIPFLTWLTSTLRMLAISLRYSLRTLYAYFFCRGARLRLGYELSRHWYHAVIIREEFLRLFRNRTP